MPLLSEREKAVCEGFLREVLLCLPILGINFDLNTRKTNDDIILVIEKKGIVARGTETSDGFLVFADSEIAKLETQSIPKGIHKLRLNLIEQEIVNDIGDGKLRFAADHCFGSPSTASSVILGCSSSGLEAWKNKDGLSLKAIQLQKLEK